ncbi:hypothetical protein PPL_08458 [Heterostelium album PN500]|uniref:EGF-like domain-containing protein n=1 Tax=Heterostelium pallidum (strain ATCC 26659 / Pp 5 / PN500) TaxID=670386 RepID=D3BI90_HETP5|nr:hypothetical protein PPL_08458 [Heterostelium album PN500]EFA78990.1 hypothetical protein PPL_08458 [Heterostelium album PN500]|eukprot:XP_020431114.1 hypothetical protein PPL_08458 [Heterostelium album PN500]
MGKTCNSIYVSSAQITNSTECTALNGTGSTIIQSNFFENFTKLYSLALDSVEPPSTFLIDLNKYNPNVKYLQCNRCNITKIDNVALYYIRLILRNNPISGTITSRALGYIQYFDYTATDSIYRKDVHFSGKTPFPDTNWKYPESVFGHLSSLPDLTGFSSSSFKQVVFEFGPNFISPPDFSNMSTWRDINDLTLIDNNVNKVTITNFPFEALNIKFLTLKGIDFETPSKFLNMSLIPQITIDKCNLNINGEIPFSLLHPELASFTFTSSNITKMIDLTLFSDNLLSVIGLNGNQIAGELPPNPRFFALEVFGNKLTGSIPSEYCYTYSKLGNNLLSGDLPSCYVCHLRDPIARSYIAGNNFNNYQDSWTTSQYPPCTTAKVTSLSKLSKLSSLTITGVDLGWTSTLLYFPSTSNPLEQPFVSYPRANSIINVAANGPYYNLLLSKGYLNFTLLDINQNFILPLEESGPIVYNISVYPYGNVGYSFFIIGKSFGSSTVNISITFGQLPCYATTVSGDAVECLLYGDSIPENQYTVTVSTKLTNGSIASTTTSYWFKRTFPFITAIKSCPLAGGLVTLYGSFGPIHNDSSVTIGKLDCAIQNISDSLIVCNLDTPGTPGPKNVSLIVNLVSWKAMDYFMYEGEFTCDSNCNGHGFCQNGFCLCYKGYVGAACADIQQSGTGITMNTTGDGTTITTNDSDTSDVKFNFVLRSIVEFSGVRETIRTLALKNWTFTGVTNYQNFSQFGYYTLFETANISYTIQQFNVATQLQFAGSTLQMEKDTIKLSVKVENWRYLGKLNTIQVVLESNMVLPSDYDPSDPCSKTLINTFGETTLNYLSFEHNGVVMYGRFMDKVLSDGRPTFSVAQVLNQGPTSIIVGINFPYCNECILDPDFSLLVKPDRSNSDDACSNQSTSQKQFKWLLPTVIVVSIVGAAAIITILVFTIKSRFFIKFTKEAGLVCFKKRKSMK